MSEPGVPPPPYTPPPPPPTVGGSGPVSSNRSLMIVLSYFGPLALIPLLTEKNDPEVQWHAKHGLVLFAADIIYFIAVSILVGMMQRVIGYGCFSGMIFRVFYLLPTVVHILCIIKGVNGQRFIIPGISQYADRF